VGFVAGGEDSEAVDEVGVHTESAMIGLLVSLETMYNNLAFVWRTRRLVDMI
jgi:hypothetical protein